MEKHFSLNNELILELGVKSDPIRYRYSFEWLFDLMSEEGVKYVQLGSFFELYFLSDNFFLRLKEDAERRNIVISSIFTSHRELGGFMMMDEEFRRITLRNYKRLIEIAEVVGASSTGSSMGGVLRDQLHYREKGVEAFIEGFHEIMHYAKEHDLQWLTLELMSCYAEPPCNVEEMIAFGSQLTQYHEQHPEDTVKFGYCADISHGWANRDKVVLQNNEDYFVSAIPFLYEFHFKNTDSIYHETFGFEPENLARGIVSIRKIRSMLLNNKDRLPVNRIIGYLELPGPKLGRDYSDRLLERMLRESLRHIKREFLRD